MNDWWASVRALDPVIDCVASVGEVGNYGTVTSFIEN